MLNSTPSARSLKQLKRSYETTRRPENCIDVTLGDEYNRIIDAFDALKQRLNKEPTSTAVANKYDGAKHNSSSSISQKCRTAMRLGRQ